MIYSDIHKYAYYAPLKTGTSSLAVVLRKYYDGIHYGDKHTIYQPFRMKDYLNFVTVRNPFTRVVSLYNHYAGDPQEYPHRDFCLTAIIRRLPPVSYQLARKEIKIDVILHQENLEKEFRALPFAKPDAPFVRVNVSTKYLIGITEKYRRQIINRHRQDFMAYGYDINDCPIPVFKTWEECIQGKPWLMDERGDISPYIPKNPFYGNKDVLNRRSLVPLF